ncbi:hypothetical protein EH223_07600 [candidate division KSB1 bacterium]|nr:hypothetical protein [candidate division KSB1 bacterium]RQW04408.1 MAG: hypothetical protein EH223_07600 [candidate division KSB1 bacterium]
MLGLGDFWVSSVFLLLILSTILCVVYGALNWNKDGIDDKVTREEEKKWEQEEREIEEKL